MRDQRSWTVRVDVAFLVNERLDESAVCKDKGGVAKAFEREDRTVFASPFCEEEMTVRGGYLVLVAQYWDGGRPWGDVLWASAG